MSDRTQDQFLDVIDRDEAERRFHAALSLTPLGTESVPLAEALNRVLAEDVVAAGNVPSFDRSNYDGFAVRAADTYGASEEAPRTLLLGPEIIASGVVPQTEVTAGSATSIATGGMLPRGADAVVMIEHTDAIDEQLIVRRAVTPGFGIASAGTDIAAGETVLFAGVILTSRETGVLAATGIDQVSVQRRVRVAIISTGDEIIPPGTPMQPAKVFDSNSQILADSVRELGGEPVCFGIVGDNQQQLDDTTRRALNEADVVLLSGGTSKGAGDLCYRIVDQFNFPGIVAHGVALKPGKPVCLAVEQGKAVVILPGFPTSAIFTFHEFVAPVIRRLGGRSNRLRGTATARMAVKVNSEIGRTEYMLVGLVPASPLDVAGELAAYPMGKGSGSVTTFSRADGFVTIGRHDEIVSANTPVTVQLLGHDLQVADLVVIGSHCVGLDFLLSQLQRQDFHTKFLAVGSTSGLEAVRRGECDLAGIHLLDEETGQYNRPFLADDIDLIEGYRRCQGVVYRLGDDQFEGREARDAIAAVVGDADCRMVNRNQGSGTRILIDQLLGDKRPSGYQVQTRSHNAVAAAVAQRRADWGVAIESVAAGDGLGFLPLQDEQYDFAVHKSRIDRPTVTALRELLADPAVRAVLEQRGLRFGHQVELAE